MTKSILSPQDVVKQYIETGLVLRETTLNGDYKTGNREWGKIVKLFKILEKDKELASISLQELFHNENVITKAKAAAHCLSLAICVKEAIKVLENIAGDKKNGIFGFNAEMTLKVYREQGYLKVYPTQKI